MASSPVQIQLPSALSKVFTGDARYRFAHGGRGSGKSHAFATMALVKAYEKKRRILCAREIQNSIKDSVFKLLKDKIDTLGLPGFHSNESAIWHENGSEFIFKGLKNNVAEIKSMEGIDICYIEEAQKVSEDSWSILIPTIRDAGSEIWAVWNPGLQTDATSQRFQENEPPNSVSVHINYDQNPWLTDELKAEAEYLKKVNIKQYRHIWLGEYKDPTSGGAVCYSWSVHNIDESAVYHPNLKLYLTCDFNVDPMCWMVAHRTMLPDNKQQFEFIDEICFGPTNLRGAASEFFKRYGRHMAGAIITGDATGKARSDMALNPNDSKYKVILQELSSLGMRKVTLDVPTGNPHEDIRVETWNARLCSSDGVRRIRVHPRCKRLIWNMDNLRYIAGTSEIAEPSTKAIEKDTSETLKYTKHPFDAASYLVYQYDPVKRDALTPKAPYVYPQPYKSKYSA